MHGADVPPLHILSHFKTTKFEFVFTPRTRAKSHELLQTVDLLIREFNATQKVREVRMRGLSPASFLHACLGPSVCVVHIFGNPCLELC